VSPGSGLVLLGVVGAAHCVRGEVRLKSFTEDPLAIARYKPLTTERGRPVAITAARRLKDDMLVVRFEGIGDRNAAEALTHQKLFAPRSALGQAGEDEYFHADLVGLEAVTSDGRVVGRVVALHDFGGGDVIEVAPDRGPALLYPFTRAVVPAIDLAGGRLTLVPPEETGEDKIDGEEAPPPARGRRRGR
jgi:16S rRNA processing protein RimM